MIYTSQTPTKLPIFTFYNINARATKGSAKISNQKIYCVGAEGIFLEWVMVKWSSIGLVFTLLHVFDMPKQAHCRLVYVLGFSGGSSGGCAGGYAVYPTPSQPVAGPPNQPRREAPPMACPWQSRLWTWTAGRNLHSWLTHTWALCSPRVRTLAESSWVEVEIDLQTTKWLDFQAQPMPHYLLKIIQLKNKITQRETQPYSLQKKITSNLSW